MALDVEAIQKELEGLKAQRYEVSQRVRAARPPYGGPLHGSGDLGPTRPPTGLQRHGAGGPPFGYAGRPADLGPMRGVDHLSGRAGGPRDDRLGPRNLGGSGAGVAPPFGTRGARGDDALMLRGNGAEGSRRDGPPSFGSRGSGSMSVHDPHRDPFGGPYGHRGSTYQHDLRGGRDWGRERGGSQDGGPGRAGAAAAAGLARRRVLSSVVVGATRASEDGTGTEDVPQPGNGMGNSYRHGDGPHERDQPQPDEAQEAPRGSKRPALPLPDADNAKRARRLLGRTLLGTLQKFRQEDAQFKASDAAVRRAELARKAEEKAVMERERLRVAAAGERQAKRLEDLSQLMDINLATDIKILELIYAKRVSRKRKLHAFLRAGGNAADSGGAPAVYWAPARHTPETQALLAAQQQGLAQWEAGIVAELEREKDGMVQRSAARKAAMVERLQQRSMAGTGVQAERGGGAGEEDREHAEDAELAAGELDAGQLEEEQQQEQEQAEGQLQETGGGEEAAPGVGDGDVADDDDGAGVQGMHVGLSYDDDLLAAME